MKTTNTPFLCEDCKTELEEDTRLCEDCLDIEADLDFE